jgi:hypothetical protein
MHRAVVFLAVSLVGCTAVDTARLPSSRVGPGELFVTAADMDLPYESLGIIQGTRKGAVVFGFWDVAGTTLQAGLDETLLPQVRQMGGDGIINVKFQQTQFLAHQRILGLILFFIPFPSNVTITGEVVRLKRGGPGAASLVDAARFP